MILRMKSILSNKEVYKPCLTIQLRRQLVQALNINDSAVKQILMKLLVAMEELVVLVELGKVIFKLQQKALLERQV